MRKTTPIALVFLVLTFSSGAWQVTALSAEDPRDAATRWEYRVLTKEQVLALGNKNLATGLNKLGEDGWELVAVEPMYIFKRPRQQRTLEGLRHQLALAEADVAMWKERATWSERMASKGYLPEQQFQVDKQRLKAAEFALENARRQLGLVIY